MTAKDLKNALLQEAVQGKLVPQIAAEGNARDLLEEIRKEKAKLVKDGKLKKEKPLPEITEDEIPFDIPENWCWCNLGELGLYRKGPFGSSLTKSMFVPKSNDSIKVYEQKNAIQKDYTLGEYYISKNKFETMQSFIVEPSDIIVSCAGTIGEVYKLPNDAPIGIINQALMRVKLFNDNLSSFWMMYFDYVLKKEASKQGAGTAIKNIPPFEILKAYPFPLPPLAEQKRIVATIEKFMPLIEEYGKKETELKAFNEQIGALTKKAILQEAVQGKLVPQITGEGNAKDLLEEIKKEKAKVAGKASSTSFASKTRAKEFPPITDDEIPFDIPENWCWCRLGELVDTNIGLTYSPSDIIIKGGTEVLRSNNIKNGKIVYDDLVHVSKNVPEKCLSKKGDLLICARNGSKALVGKSALIEKDGMAFGAFMAIVRSPINPYLLHFINSPVYRARLEGVNTTTINQITQDNLRETLFPLPPLNEQKRIITAIENLLPLSEKLGE